MSFRRRAGCDWDKKRRVEAGTVHGMLGAGERARGMTVAASAVQGVWGSGGRTIASARGYDWSPFPKSNTVSAEGGVAVPESC